MLSFQVNRLSSLGVTGHLLDWFTDYLRNRSERVVIDAVASQYLPVTSGVPQVCIVGPLLFVIFINDLPEFIPNQAKTALFADDTKLYRSISSISDCESLQRDISSLNDWSQNSIMKFNALKCKVLTITRNLNYNFSQMSVLKFAQYYKRSAGCGHFSTGCTVPEI
jgi:hypothetical protein